MSDGNEASGQDSHNLAKLSEEILSLISDGQHEKANTLIDAARHWLPASEVHRLDGLSAVLEEERGNLQPAIDLLRQAIEEKPTWLPHLYRLSVMLMDAERWPEANTVLDQLIQVSEINNEPYFLDDARFRKVMCLKALDRSEEAELEKAKITPGAKVFIGDRSYGLDDLG